MRGIANFVVTAAQMRAIEDRIFAAGMPVVALMEKVGGLLAQRIQSLYPYTPGFRVGILVGPGHNGGDALVVARELHFRGYSVIAYCPFTKLKELTAHHVRYADSLGIPVVSTLEALKGCNLLVDGLFGFGLTQSLEGAIVQAIHHLNQASIPIVSIDLPSGLHADTGEVLGVTVQATHTLCLGLWKLGLLQDHALAYCGQAELLPFDIPLADVRAVVGDPPGIERLVPEQLWWPLPRPATTHKYQMGHLLLVAGSRRYGGAAILAGLGARASGVGMLTIAAPASLQSLILTHLPEAIVLACPETETGAIAPEALSTDLLTGKYSAVACGCGLTPEAEAVVNAVLQSHWPLVLDADGLNILAQRGAAELKHRPAPTILTPHQGEFQRLFPTLAKEEVCRARLVRKAAEQTGAWVLLKGARVAIASPQGLVWINPDSTPALARGGSGDVLTGLMGGLLAQAVLQPEKGPETIGAAVQTAAWWHAQAGMRAAQLRSELGVDAMTLASSLLPIPWPR